MFEDWFMIKSLMRALMCSVLLMTCPAMSADGNGSQHRAAEEYLAALATGDAHAMAQTLHEDELVLLRKRLVDALHLEADRDENLLRGRLFGTGMPLSDIERLTPQNFFVALSARLRFGGRNFERVEWLAAVPDSGGMVQMVGRGRLPRDQGTVRIPVLVSLVPWGKDWKAALPLELQAQIDDLMTGRTRLANAPASSSVAANTNTPGAGGATNAAPASPQAILVLLTEAEVNLKARNCEDYYSKQMSPNFRRTTATKALHALVTSCENRAEMRDKLLTALSLARSLPPRYEYQGTRAIYDLRGNGLPFNELVLEQIDKRWYIAE
jgi:hypothetical protein